MQAVIVLEHLTKMYGRRRGVHDLSFEVQPGEVFGYLGPNGAGKTTTIRQLLGFIHPTSGRAEVLGLDSRTASLAIHRQVGYLPGELALYEHMTGRDLLEYFGRLRGGVDAKQVRALVERLELDPLRPIRSLSKGNKQKIGLVQAFMHRPKLLILDEPTSGLDPLVQQEFLRMVREAQQAGSSVFLSSHVLAEVEGLADRVGIIRDGELVAIDEMQAIKAKAVRRITIEFAQPLSDDLFRGLPGVHNLTFEGNRLTCRIEGTVDPLIKQAARFEVVNITSYEPDLEEVFLSFYTGGAHAV